jgi:ferredoxin
MLRLDPIRCDGYGMCAIVLPERITLDEWGYPVIEPGPVQERLLAHARRAVDVCPVLALSLRPMAATAAAATSGTLRQLRPASDLPGPTSDGPMRPRAIPPAPYSAMTKR